MGKVMVAAGDKYLCEHLCIILNGHFHHVGVAKLVILWMERRSFASLRTGDEILAAWLISYTYSNRRTTILPFLFVYEEPAA